MEKEFIYEMFRFIDGCDWESLRSRFTDDATYERPGYEPLRGLEEILHFYEHVRIIASGEHQLDHLVVDDVAGGCWGRFVGKGRDGSDLDERFADVYTFENGKIKTRASYFFRPAI